MTADARDLLSSRVFFNGTYNLLMTMTTGFFRNFLAVRFDLNGFRITPKGKIERMFHSIRCLCPIFPQKMGWGMAIIANGYGVMAGFDPAGMLFLHDMTIGASIRVVREIGISFGIKKGKTGQPNGNTYKGYKDWNANLPLHFNEHLESATTVVVVHRFFPLIAEWPSWREEVFYVFPT